MKTAALIIGIVSVYIFTSCRCDIDEKDSKENTTESENTKKKTSGNNSENDTLNIR